jgi:hypothetical protein
MSLLNHLRIHAKNLKCFGETPQGFETIMPLNIIIGRKCTRRWPAALAKPNGRGTVAIASGRSVSTGVPGQSGLSRSVPPVWSFTVDLGISAEPLGKLNLPALALELGRKLFLRR